MIFICLILVKTKKKICLAKFPDYADYMNTTGRFLPNGVGAVAFADHLWHGGSIYWLEHDLFSSDNHRIFCSHGLRTDEIANLYTDETEDAVYFSSVTIRS